MTYPIRVAVVAPKDKPWPLPSSIIMGKVSQYMVKAQRWLQAEVGCTFDYKLHWLTSAYTHEFLALEERSDGTKKDWRDATGRGIDSGKVLHYCGRQELGFKSHVEGKNVRRDIYVVHYAGGWAGGTNNQTPTEDSGWMLMGDWNILGCLLKNNPSEMLGDGYAFSHEMTHFFGISSHPEFGGVIQYLPDGEPVPTYLEPFRDGNLCIGQKQQLISKNMRFLKDV